MVSFRENEIVITIATSSLSETLAELQKGNIEMMKTLLSMGSGGKDLEMERARANGGYFALQLLQATFHLNTVESTEKLTTQNSDCSPL